MMTLIVGSKKHRRDAEILDQVQSTLPTFGVAAPEPAVAHWQNGIDPERRQNRSNLIY